MRKLEELSHRKNQIKIISSDRWGRFHNCERITVRTHILGQAGINICCAQYGANMIVSVHVAQPLSSVSTFKAVFGLEESDPVSISGSVSP